MNMGQINREKIRVPILEIPEYILANETIRTENRIPEIVIYREVFFQEEAYRTNCNVKYIGDLWNDDISSIIIVSGEWELYKDANYKHNNQLNKPLVILGPGYYPDLRNLLFEKNNDDVISSFKCVKI